MKELKTPKVPKKFLKEMEEIKKDMAILAGGEEMLIRNILKKIFKQYQSVYDDCMSGEEINHIIKDIEMLLNKEFDIPIYEKLNLKNIYFDEDGYLQKRKEPEFDFTDTFKRKTYGYKLKNSNLKLYGVSLEKINYLEDEEGNRFYPNGIPHPQDT